MKKHAFYTNNLSGHVVFLQTAGVMPKFGHHALNLLFAHYVHRIAKKTVPAFVVHVYDANLVNLPWQDYLPGIQEIELMLEVSLQRC